MRSAWLKWARAVQHQKTLIAEMTEFRARETYEYVRTDNEDDYSDPLVRIHWRLRIKEDYPEGWSVLLGDVLTNLRAALDHAFWAAAVEHSGPPARPNRVMWPITSTAGQLADARRNLQPLVPEEAWELVELAQPVHEGDEAHMHPLEVLRWLSNVDKHRAVHVVGRTNVDMGPITVRGAEVQVVEDWRHEGVAADGTVVARLKFRRPADSLSFDVGPTFAHVESIQVSEKPTTEYRSIGSAADVMTQTVLGLLVTLGDRLGLPVPDTDSLDLGPVVADEEPGRDEQTSAPEPGFS